MVHVHRLRRAARALMALPPLLALATCTGVASGPQDTPQGAIGPVHALSLALPASMPDGGARLVAAFELQGSGLEFGGLSGAALDGDRLHLLGDRGWLFGVRLLRDDEGVITGFRDWHGRPLPRDAKGRTPDAESLAPEAGGGLLAAFEGTMPRLQSIALERDALALGPPRPLALEPAPPGNEGVEALARLGDGRLLALSEGAWLPGGLLAGVLPDDGDAQIAYRPARGFRPTGADSAGGRLFVLERSFSFLGGFDARIVALDETAIVPGAVLEGEEIVRLGEGIAKDNFEAIAAMDDGDGGYWLIILSDDNQSILQRTLLYQFRYRP